MAPLQVIFALLAMVQGEPAAPKPAPVAAPLPARRFELGDLLELHGEDVRLDLCPERSSRSFIGKIGLRDDLGYEHLRLIEGGDLATLIHDLFDPSQPEPPLDIDADDASLTVTAPAPVLEEIARLLAGVRAALIGDERLEVRVLSGDFGSDLPALLAPDEADRREKAWIDSGAARVCRTDATNLVDGLATSIHDVDEESCARDWLIEVAQDAAIYGPVAGIDSLGLTASVRSARWPGATYLDLALRYAEPSGTRRELTVAPQITLATPVPPGPKDDPSHRAADGSTQIREKVPLRFELAATRFVSVAGSFLVPDGKVLWIPCRGTTQAGPADFLIDVRVRGPFRPPLFTLHGAADAKVARAIVHQGGLVSRGITSPAFDETSFGAGRDAIGSGPAWWPSTVAAYGDLRELGWNLLQTTPEAERAPEVRVVPLGESHLLLQAPPVERDKMFAALQHAFDAVAPFEIHGRIRDGATVVADFRLPALSERPTQLWSGVAGPYLFDWTIDEAEGTSDGCPETSWFLDGFALSFVVAHDEGKATTIDVNGVVNLLAGPPSAVKRDDPRTPLVEKIEPRRLLVAEKRKLDTSGGTTLRIGETGLVVEITVKRE